MKKIKLTLLLFTTSLIATAQTEAGSMYISFSTQPSPFLTYYGLNTNGSFYFGNEWVTGITVDGDDDNNLGNDYWDKDDTERYGNFNVTGDFGYFVADGFLTGVGINYLTSNQTNINVSNGTTYIYNYNTGYNSLINFKRTVSTKYKYNGFVFSPFAKYYMDLGMGQLFFNASLSFGTINGEYEEEEKYNTPYLQGSDDDDKLDPLNISRVGFGTGLSLFLTDYFALEPSINYSLNRFKREIEVPIYDPIYGYMIGTNDEDEVTKSSSLFIKVAASIFIN